VMKRSNLVVMFLLLTGVPAHSQQMAITLDDLPAQGEKPAGITQMEIVQSILSTLKQQRMPPTYGFINGKRAEEDASAPAVLMAWRAAGQPMGSHTWAHGYKIAEVNMEFEDYLWNAPYARCMDKHDDAAIGRLHDSYLSAADQFYGLFRQLSQMVYGREVKYVLLMHVGAFDAKMLPELLAFYRNKGVRFISLPSAISDPAYRDDPDIGAPHGGTLLELMMQKKKLGFPKNTKPYKELDDLCR